MGSKDLRQVGDSCPVGKQGGEISLELQGSLQTPGSGAAGENRNAFVFEKIRVSVPPTPRPWRCYRRTSCRLCGSMGLRSVIQLTPTPPANDFLSADQLSLAQERFPLEVVRCPACGHLQLHDVVNPEILFNHYLYVSGTSSVTVDHLER